MWHEARKQEKKIREAVIDFQKRAERRRQHYDKMRRDPMQLLRIYGTRCRLHLNPAASKLSSAMIPWQGDETNMISRYDVRINLDYIPERSKQQGQRNSSSIDEWEEQRCNYERYRFLVLNHFKGTSEQEALAAIEVNEMYLVPGRPSSSRGKDKAKSQARAAIAYSYGGEGGSEQERRDEQLLDDYLRDDDDDDEEKTFSSESEYEMDVDVDHYSARDVDRLNVMALDYGIAASSFSRNLRSEKQHMEEAKLARLTDMEKTSLPGKRARRERRQLRERTHVRLPTPPTYAQRDSPTYEPYRPEQRSRSSSRSSSPTEGQVEFITEFGGGGGVSQPAGHTHQSTVATVSSRISEGGKRQERRREQERERRGRREEGGRSSRSSHHSRSPRRRSSHHSSHRDSHSRSRSRSRDRSWHKRSQRSSNRDRSSGRRQRSRSWSRDRSHTHPSSSTSSSGKTTPPPKIKSSLKPKVKTTKEKGKMTPQERLKKKMQAQLTKQFKQDKKLQKEKEHRMEAERIEREEEMRDKMRKIRGRERQEERWSKSPSPHGYTSYGIEHYIT